jgi:hypothetical protein
MINPDSFSSCTGVHGLNLVMAQKVSPRYLRDLCVSAVPVCLDVRIAASWRPMIWCSTREGRVGGLPRFELFDGGVPTLDV